jgi:branched-chain amino acid transport system substrate-binding protein
MKYITACAVAATSLLGSTLLAMPTALAEDIVSVPNLSYRTGPFAPTGVPLMNGQRDYMTMINERDGGINGVRIGYEECETGYSIERGLECYEKAKATGLVAQPWSSGLTLELLPKAKTDRIPILAPGYGFSPIADGRTFQWSFNPPVSYWDGASMILEYISRGDAGALRGRKIALLYLEAAYGDEPVLILQSMAARYGFTFIPIAVSAREMQNQAAQWQRISSEAPDFVLLWGWGTMNAAAVAEAARSDYPMDRLIGIWWSGNDTDLAGIGAGAKGYRALSWNVPVPDAPAMKDIEKYVVNAQKSEVDEGELGSVFYQRGALISMFTVEAIRIAQERFDSKVVTAEQLRWGLENLKLDDERLEAIGMAGMIAPFALSCDDHNGRAGAWILEWDGTKFSKVSDLLPADDGDISALVQAEAKTFAEANPPWPDNDCK